MTESTMTGVQRFEEHLDLPIGCARELLRLAGLESVDVQVRRLKRWNHVWQIVSDDAVFYVKSHTKDWYAWDLVVAPALAVDHEADAYRLLANAGLPTPRVVLVDETRDNPLGRPFLMLAELEGMPFTEHADRVGDLGPAAHAVGRYLAAMHAIRFPRPGFLGRIHRHAPPDPGGYQHPCWGFEPFARSAFETWARDEVSVGEVMVDEARELFGRDEDALRRVFAQPRFVHGDCHASQFFVRDAHPEHVSGVVDMEVSSAGCPLVDFVKLGIEMGGRFPVSARWWQPLFDGYGGEPAYPLVKIALLAADHFNYTCLGHHSWQGSRAEIFRRLLAAQTWEELFDGGREAT